MFGASVAPIVATAVTRWRGLSATINAIDEAATFDSSISTNTARFRGAVKVRNDAQNNQE